LEVARICNLQAQHIASLGTEPPTFTDFRSHAPVQLELKFRIKNPAWKRRGSGKREGVMTQSLYAHMNKGNKKKGNPA
jgi:hypothetical protein